MDGSNDSLPEVPYDLRWMQEPAGDAEDALIRQSVVRIRQALVRLADDVRRQGPAPESRAAADLAGNGDFETSDGETHLINAHRVIYTAIAAGADHHRAFADGVMAGRTTVSNWTLARGALEAYARAHYLLRSADVGELMVRHVALVLAELRYSAHGTYATRDGRAFDPAAYQQAMRGMLEDLGLPPAKPASMTELTAALLEDTAPGSEGRLRYSQLSSAAHGETIGVQIFIPTEGAAFALPRVLVQEAAHAIVACSITVGNEIVAYFGADLPTRERWASARSAAASAMLKLAEER